MADEHQQNLQRLRREALKSGYQKLGDYTKALDAAGHASGYAAGFRAGYEKALLEQAEQLQTLIKALSSTK